MDHQLGNAANCRPQILAQRGVSGIERGGIVEWNENFAEVGQDLALVDWLAGEDAEAEAVGGGVFEVGGGEVQFA